MSTVRRHGGGWAAVGDAAGLINPMNGEGIDYGLESGMILADLFPRGPGRRPRRLRPHHRRTLRRLPAHRGGAFSFLIGHPWILRNGLRLAVGTQAVANITLQVMGNLIDGETEGLAPRVLDVVDRGLRLADPLLRPHPAAAA